MTAQLLAKTQTSTDAAAAPIFSHRASNNFSPIYCQTIVLILVFLLSKRRKLLITQIWLTTKLTCSSKALGFFVWWTIFSHSWNYLQSREKLSEAKIYWSMPEPKNSQVNAVYFFWSAEIFESVVSHAVFVYNEPRIIRHAISSADICAASLEY